MSDSFPPARPNPPVGHQTDLLEILFDRMPMGIVILDRDLRVVRFNPTWAEYVDRYIPAPTSQVMAGAYWFDLTPGTEASSMPLFERVLAGETVRREAWREESGGVVSYWDFVLTPLIQDGQVVGILDVTTDATQRKRAEQVSEEQVEQRTRELQTLLEVLAASSAPLALAEMLTATLERLVVLFGVARAVVFLRDESDNLMLAAVQPPQSLYNKDLTRLIESGLRVIASGEVGYVQVGGPCVLLPLRSRRQAVGILGIVGSGDDRFVREQLALFVAIADQLGLAVERARLYKQAEQAAILEERQRLARELHDSVTQSLYSLTLFAEAGRELAGQGDLEAVLHQLARIGATAQQSLKEMRLLLYELRPVALEQDGLAGALRRRLEMVEKRSGVEARLFSDELIELPAPVEEALYRVALEALNNALKHAFASAVQVKLCARGGQIELEVSDNGQGFAPLTPPHAGGLGLIGMRERMEKLGGMLLIYSSLGNGTTVIARVPL